MGQGTRDQGAGPTRTPAARPGRRTGTYTQTERVLELLATLRARRAPVRLDTLAEEVSVSVKQLRRDLAMLAASGHRPELVRVEGRSAVRLSRGKSETITLTLRERFALLAMRDVFASLEGTPLAEDARSVFDKVAATLPDELARDLAGLGPRFLYLPDGGIKSYAKHADVVDELLTGALHRQTVDARYTPAHGKKLAGGFDPWGVALYRNGLYAIGRWEHEASPRVFAVERFTSAARRRRSRFEVPAGFSLATFFGGAFGVFPGGQPERVVLEFDAAVAPIVLARRYHASQDAKRLRDGRVRMELYLAITPEFAAWVVGWGPMVDVLSPASLREQVRREHRAAVTPAPARSVRSR
jgi:predicted DNA-binding transcriptional regulator YafY